MVHVHTQVPGTGYPGIDSIIVHAKRETSSRVAPKGEML